MAHEYIKAEEVYSTSQYEAISQSLDAFCKKMADSVVCTYQ